MKQLKRNLPPLTALVAFEASARLGSFTAAADELNVSREAVSRQIRALEGYLGVSLFERDANRAVMGLMGERFFATVSPNLWAIATAAQELTGDISVPATEDAPMPTPTTDLDLPTILVVDDTPGNIHHLHGLLKDEYRVIAQTSGKEALNWLSSETPDLILLDVRMPEMDGYELCTRIKNTASLSDIPVIFLTSLNDPADETHGLEIGACDFITRPIVPAVLKARMRSHLDLRQTRNALEDLLTRRADRLQKAEEMLVRISKDISAYQVA